MKILSIHADFIEFEAKKEAFKGAEKGIEKGKHRIEECLVIFTAVEKSDESNIKGVLDRYIVEVEKIADQVSAEKIVVYPYAHLSSDLASPVVAEQFLKDAQKELERKFIVDRAPFGWYKSFNISCKGHPLSELSRQFGAEEKSLSLKKEFKDESFVLSDAKLSKEETIKLTAAYYVGNAIKELFPKADVGSAGFYQDQSYIDISGATVKQDDLKRIEKQIQKLTSSIVKESSIKEISLSKVDSELQKDIAKDLGKKPSAYSIGKLQVVPLFNDPFVAGSSIKALKLLNVASAYWKNNQTNKQLTRIYCIAFSSEKEMESYLKKQEEAHNRSHLKIGKEQGLFVVSDLVGPGLPLLAPKGALIRSEIIKFLWQLHNDKGYQQVVIPHIAKDLLYKKSGHWEKFGDELFHVKGRHENFVLKPMNCPHHIQIYTAFSYSYRDLPVRFFEPSTVYRDEKPGQLTGLSRVRSITQDDGHIFCRISQIAQEVKTITGIILSFYKTLGMDKDYWVSLSVRGDDHSLYLGSEDVWKIAESSLEKVAKENKLPFKKIKGEAAFYGPKLDFIFKDALGREWQLATVQLDFNLPERFELSYMNEQGKKERPVMIHRAISGSLERFMSVIIEHFAGKFPAWLSPVQVKILTISDKHLDFSLDVVAKMRKKGIRVELDDRVETMGKKVREAQMEHVNYILAIGDKEVEKNTVAVRTRVGETTFDVPIDKFITEILDEINERRLS